MKRINKVILIIIDTLRAKNLGLYGQNPSPSPNIDKLGESGIVFDNAYTTSTKTDPAITSIMTGRFPLSQGLVNIGMHIAKEEEVNLEKILQLSQILQSSGFKTAAVDWLSRWHRKGFNYYSGKITKDPRSYLVVDRLSFFLDLIRRSDIVTVRFLRRAFLSRFYYSLFKGVNPPYDPAEMVIAKAKKILNLNQEKLFLYIHLWDAHWPHTRPKGLKSYLFDGLEHVYNAEISYLDHEIGQLIEDLEKKGQLDETLIIITGDHGENLYRHGTPFSHENLNEDVVRIPLIIKHPDFSAKRIKAMVQHVDILPTILELLNIKIPKSIEGKSILPIILGKKDRTRDFVYFEDIMKKRSSLLVSLRRRGIRINNIKYIETLKGSKAELARIEPREDIIISKRELYDLEKDPQEKNNLIDRASKLGEEMSIKLHQLILKLNNNRLQNHPSLKRKIEKTVKVIKTAITKYRIEDLAIAWKGGKDTTTMMHIIKNMYGGKIPFKVFFNDTTLEFEETYQFIEKMKKLWNLDMVVIKHDARELKEFRQTKDLERKKELSRIMKITAIDKALKKYKFKGFMLGIRRDENSARTNEKYFSKRADHIRIHPMLDWTENDIWQYTKHFGVPYNELYDQGYRSIGEKPFTTKSKEGDDERSGRDQEKEKAMSRLRKMGYW